MRWRCVGEQAFLTTLDARWCDAIDARAALQARLSRASFIRDFVLTETEVLVCADAAPNLTSVLDEAWGDAPTACSAHEIEVRYGGKDLAEVASELAILQHDVIALHTSSALRVSFTGFLPGFAYLRGLHPALATIPRRVTPRPRVAARSVAIAGGMSAIYPAASPGGWQLLGEAIDFDVRIALRPGDHVRFRATERLHVDLRDKEAAPSRTHLRIERMRGIAIIVDGEATRRLRDGVAPGGPLLPHVAMRANAAVGNAPECALIERIGELTCSVSASGPRRVANEDGEVITLRPGETVTLPWRTQARVGYLALEGGFDVPHMLGGRGTLLSIAAGGFRGRPLRSGDCIDLGAPTNTRFVLPPSAPEAMFSLVAGPDFDSLATRVKSLLTCNLKVAHSSDRTGTRLVTETAGIDSLQPMSRSSTPLVRGCVQLTPMGEFLVMGPDHPITGGYPLVGYVPSQQLEALFALPLGAPLQLALRDD